MCRVVDRRSFSSSAERSAHYRLQCARPLISAPILACLITRPQYLRTKRGTHPGGWVVEWVQYDRHSIIHKQDRIFQVRLAEPISAAPGVRASGLPQPTTPPWFQFKGTPMSLSKHTQPLAGQESGAHPHSVI